MISSGMMICSFHLKQRFRRGQADFLPLNQVYCVRNGEHTYADIFDMIVEFCTKNFSFSDDESNMKIFAVGRNSVQIEDDNRYPYRAISFTICSGAYGIESNMTDRQTQEVKYKRQINDADIKEFKCLVFIPKDIGNMAVFKGILIFQTVASYGVKTITTKKLRDYFSTLDLTFETRSVSVRSFIEKLIDQGALHKLTLVKNSLSPDPSDNILISRGQECTSYLKPQLQPAWLQKLLLFFDSGQETDVYKIDGEAFDNIKICFKLGDHYRTVGLRYIDRMSIVEDIPDSIYKNGHYDNQTLIDYMMGTAHAYQEKMVSTVEGEE